LSIARSARKEFPPFAHEYLNFKGASWRRLSGKKRGLLAERKSKHLRSYPNRKEVESDKPSRQVMDDGECFGLSAVLSWNNGNTKMRPESKHQVRMEMYEHTGDVKTRLRSTLETNRAEWKGSGQKILIVPDLDLVLVATARTGLLRDRGRFLNLIVGEHLLPAVKDRVGLPYFL
jgi:hypothetical protein